MTKRALILVDIQNDFMPSGSLPVPNGDAVIEVANRIMGSYDLVVATQDFHPAGHLSFAANHEGRKPGEVIDLDGLSQILWTAHCVEGTKGCEFVDALNTDRIDHIVRKGTDRMIDSYSGFFDNGHRKATGLGDYLKEEGVTEVHICGLATDYCVKFTALDARELGFETSLIQEAVRGVELNPGDIEKALAELESVGVALI